VCQKVLNPKPGQSRKSPLSGWAEGDHMEKDSNYSNGINQEVALHANQEHVHDDDNQGENGAEEKVNGEQEVRNGDTEVANDSEKKGDEIDDSAKANGDNAMAETNNSNENVPKVEIEQDDNENTTDNMEAGDRDYKKGTETEGSLSVQREEVYSVISDKDKTVVKSEDYLG